LHVPGSQETGVRCFFDLLCREIQNSRARGETDGLWHHLTNRWKWNESDACESITMFVALRAWATGLSAVQELVEDWLFQPWSYYGQRQRIYKELIGNLGRYFRDGHPERYYYPDAFKLNVQAYDQSWKFLRDLRMLSAAAGLKGVIVLFDEFENMLNGLKRHDYKFDAFWNLLQFGRQKQFPGLSAFAITPAFFQTLDTFIPELRQFPTFEMQPLEVSRLQELAGRIRETHALAFGWDAEAKVATRYCEQPSKRPPPFPSRIEAGKLSSKSLAFLTRPSKRLNEHWLTALARRDGLLRPVHSIAADPGGCHRTPREWRQRRIEFKHGLG